MIGKYPKWQNGLLYGDPNRSKAQNLKTALSPFRRKRPYLETAPTGSKLGKMKTSLNGKAIKLSFGKYPMYRWYKPERSGIRCAN